MAVVAGQDDLRSFGAALDPGVAELLGRLDEDPAGYARDLVLALSPWPFDLAEITVPVAPWYGAHDHSPVHSPDHGRTLATRLPAATRHLVRKAGGSIL